MTCLATTKTVKTAIMALKTNGCSVKRERDFITVFDGETKVYQALQNSMGNWIVRTMNSERITWK